MCRRDQRFTYSRSKRCALCCRKILERFGARLENHRGCDTYYPAIGFLLLIIILGLQTKRQRNRVVNRGEGACARAAAAASTKSANDHRDSYLSELCQTAAHLPGVACCVLPPIPRRLCEISWRHWRNRRHCHTKCSPDLMANSLSLFSLSQGLPLPTCACRTFGAPAYKKPTASVPLSSIDVVEQRLVCVCACSARC